MPATRDEILAALQKAYNMEVETLINYLSISLDLDGVRADFIKQALAADITGEMTHAQQLGNRHRERLARPQPLGHPHAAPDWRLRDRLQRHLPANPSPDPGDDRRRRLERGDSDMEQRATRPGECATP